jgi:spermidine synthase
MTSIFKELDYQKTPFGEISLRCRSEPRLDNIVLYEVKLGDEFLMSSLFTEAEVQLAKLALTVLESTGFEFEEGAGFDVVVGGLGLGYTAAAALEYSSVQSLTVVEVMEPVINWHRKGLVPLGNDLVLDARCQLVHADFFAIAAAGDKGFDPSTPERLAHAVLLDIDHSPAHWLNPANESFYTEQGLRKLIRKIHPGGLFGIWSNDPPDTAFSRLLESVFGDSESHIVVFENPYTGGKSANTVYLARNLRTV